MLGSKLDIMKTGWLNVVFAGRNQAYGAYQLRRDNARNTNRAVIIAVSMFVFALATPTIANIIMGYHVPPTEPITKKTEVKLYQPPTTPEVVQPKTMHEAARPHTNTVQNPPMKVVPDAKSIDPPLDKDFDHADPGPQTLKGDINALLMLGRSMALQQNTLKSQKVLQRQILPLQR